MKKVTKGDVIGYVDGYMQKAAEKNLDILIADTLAEAVDAERERIRKEVVDMKEMYEPAYENEDRAFVDALERVIRLLNSPTHGGDK